MATSSTRKTKAPAKSTPASKKATSSKKAKAAKPATKATKTKKSVPRAPKKAAKRDIAAELAEFGFPSAPGRTLCFTSGDADLFERGYPELRRLTDEVIPAEKAVDMAEKALDAIDPCFRIDVPRIVANYFLLGYRVGPLLFVDRNHRPENAKLRADRAALMRSNRAIDAQLLDETLEQHGFGMGDTYASWRWPKVLYLYECFLGTEPVVRSVLKFLLLAAKELKRWGFWTRQMGDVGRGCD